MALEARMVAVEGLVRRLLTRVGESTDTITSVFGRTGAVAAAVNDYTWAQIDKATSDIADITTKSHTSLSAIGTLTHAQLETQLTAVTQAAIESAFYILQLEANDTLTAATYTDMFLDIFSDSTGYSNTINTTNTTSAFSTNKYTTPVSQTGTVTWNPDSTGSISTKLGWKIVTVSTSGITLTEITKDSQSNATTWYVGTTAGGSQIGTGSFSGDTSGAISLALSASTTYYVTSDSGGSSYTYAQKNDTLNVDSTPDNLFRMTAGYAGGDQSGTHYNLATVKCEISGASTSVTETNTITVPSGIIKYRLFVKKVLTGTGAITYKISFDNGSSYSASRTLDTDYDVPGGATTSCKIQLEHSKGTGSADAYGYSLMVW